MEPKKTDHEQRTIDAEIDVSRENMRGAAEEDRATAETRRTDAETWRHEAETGRRGRASFRR